LWVTQRCLEQDHRADSAALAPAAADQLAVTSHHHHAHGQCDFCGDTFGDDDESDELTSASNAIVDMVHDGYDRLGMVYEARGDHKQAAHYYRQVIDFVRAHPDQYEPAFETTFQRLVQKLDPPPVD
jgi:hypothetical protein